MAVCEGDGASSRPSEGMRSRSKDKILANVATTDSSLAALIARAREVQATYFAEDYISQVSKRSGYRLTLLTELQDGVDTLVGYIVYRFKQSAVSVAQFAIAQEFQGQGFGKKLIKWLIQYAKKANVEIIALSSLPTSTSFYQRFAFKRVMVKGISGEDYVEGQVYMEYRCRRPLKADQRRSNSMKEAADKRAEQKDACEMQAGADEVADFRDEKFHPGCADSLNVEWHHDANSAAGGVEQLAECNQQQSDLDDEAQRCDGDLQSNLGQSEQLTSSTRWSRRLRTNAGDGDKSACHAEVLWDKQDKPKDIALSTEGTMPTAFSEDDGDSVFSSGFWDSSDIEDVATEDVVSSLPLALSLVPSACMQNQRRVWRAARA